MKTKKAILLYTVQFSFIALILLVVLRDRTFITINDGYNQYYLTMVYFGKLVREFIFNILNGNFCIPQFDFAIGLGEGILPALNYYGIGDPFLFIAVLFPVAYSTYAHTVIYFAKMYVAGLSFIYFGRSKNIQYEYILFGTSIYIGSQYFLCHGLMYPTTFLNIMISLPIICTGIDKVIKHVIDNEKKFFNTISIELVLGVTLQSLCGFYTLYMELIFAGIYALIRVLCNVKGFRNKLDCIFKLFCQVLWGILTGGIVFIPAMIGFLESGRGSDSSLSGLFSLFSLDGRLFWETYSSIVVPSGLTEIGLILPIISLLCIALAFWKEKQIKDIKIVALLFILLYCNMKFASWVAGGFTSSIYYGRWLFCMCFLGAYLSVYGAKYLENINRKIWYGFGIIVVLYLLSVFVGTNLINGSIDIRQSKIYGLYIIYTVVNIVICSLFWKKGIRKYKYTVLQMLITGSIALNIFVIFKVQEGKYYTKTYYGARQDMVSSRVQNYTGSSPFGRLDIQGNTRNDSLYMGFYSANEYLSMINENIVEFYKQYAMVAEMYGSVHHLIGLGGKGGMEDLLSVQYYDKVNEDGVEENEDYLPMGITYQEYITEVDAEKINALQKNAMLLDKIIVNKTIEGIQKSEPPNSQKDILKEIDYKISYEHVDIQENQIRVYRDSKITIEMLSEKEGEGYFYADSIIFSPENKSTVGHVYFGDVYCEFKSENAQYKHGVEETLVYFGKIKEGTNTLNISFGEEAVYEIGEYGIYLLDTKEQQILNQERRKNVLDNVIINTNSIKGTIENNENEILFLGIPYSDGWKAYINGNQVPIMRANYGFIALKLEVGENRIELEYVLPGIKAGTWLSIFGILGLVFVGLKRNKHEKLS